MLISKRYTQSVVNGMHSTAVLTVASSVNLFLVIALERFLALYKPFWHKVNIKKSCIYKCVLVVWLWAAFVFVFDLSTIICGDWEVYSYFQLAIYIALGVWIPLISILFLLTFIKAFRAIRSRVTQQQHQKQQLAEVEHIKAKIQFKLTMIFLTMFLCFIAGFTFILVGAFPNIPKETFLAKVFLSLFNLTSIFNPIWAMFQKKEFRLRYVQDNVAPPNDQKRGLLKIRNSQKNQDMIANI